MSKGNSSSRASANNRSNQMNPNNGAYQSSRVGGSAGKAARDNHANQLNPNHKVFGESRNSHSGSGSGGSLFSKRSDNQKSENQVKNFNQGFVKKHKKTILISTAVGALGLLLARKNK